MIKVQLELGGKDPAYVCDDADIEAAAASLADGAFYNTGQSCCSVERIYVQASIYPRFTAAFVDAVRGFKVGEPLNEADFIGPLTRRAQLACAAQAGRAMPSARAQRCFLAANPLRARATISPRPFCAM
jgi:acyl-CoA reductase-like NAD-dependent aldehyde dehydrogenase